MKLFWRSSGMGSFILGGAGLALLLLCGCAGRNEPAIFTSDPFGGSVPSQVSSTQNVTTGKTQLGSKIGDRLDIGDEVIVTFSDTALQQHDERIKEDGTITLEMVGPVKAAGKTPGELQKDILNLYVPKYYRPGRLTVTVKTPERYYYVGGEVRIPGQKVYPGAMTVTKAIQAAGNFTDFANKKKIRLIRADGTTIKVNWKKAIDDPSMDPPVFPGDNIHVPRRIW